ncbi:hypothetical protein BDR22DRAFT_345391 [Usnea florida]
MHKPPKTTMLQFACCPKHHLDQAPRHTPATTNFLRLRSGPLTRPSSLASLWVLTLLHMNFPIVLRTVVFSFEPVFAYTPTLFIFVIEQLGFLRRKMCCYVAFEVKRRRADVAAMGV